MSRLAVKMLVVLLLLTLMVGCGGSSQRPEPSVDEAAEPTAVTEPVEPPAVDEPVVIDNGFDCGTVTEISRAECQALVAFYEATNGSGWFDHSGWLESTMPCSWYGVSCTSGRVDMLALSFNNVQGQLPEGMAGLAQLRVLDLHNNGLNGVMPAALGQLAALEAVDLSANQIGGPIPAGLGNLPKVQSLLLAHNQLSGPLPAELGRISTLRILDLSANQIGGAIPESFGELAALESLRLSGNQLEGTIPFGLGELAGLTEIDLSFNRLTGTPPAALQEVAIRRLWGNRLDGTFASGDGAEQAVNFLGVAFTYDVMLADSVWPELVAARPAMEGPGLPWSPPEHIVFTLAGRDGPQEHMPMGLYLPAEAQIHIYPTAGLNAEVQPYVASLQALLAERPDLTTYEAIGPELEATQAGYGMVPPSNARQTLRAQAHYVTFAEGSGIAYLTQLSQGPVPVNNQELFYTFQGLTADGATFVAAFFPVRLAGLPDSAEISNEAYTTLMEDWAGYVAETTALLNGQPTAAFTPDLAVLDGLINSLSVAGTVARPALEGIWPANGESVEGQPVLQWAAWPSAVQYEVVIVDDDAFPPVAVVSQFTTETSLAVPLALEAGSYSWTVRALAADGSVLAELNRQFVVGE